VKAVVTATRDPAVFSGASSMMELRVDCSSSGMMFHHSGKVFLVRETGSPLRILAAAMSSSMPKTTSVRPGKSGGTGPPPCCSCINFQRHTPPVKSDERRFRALLGQMGSFDLRMSPSVTSASEKRYAASRTEEEAESMSKAGSNPKEHSQPGAYRLMPSLTSGISFSSRKRTRVFPGLSERKSSIMVVFSASFLERKSIPHHRSFPG